MMVKKVASKHLFYKRFLLNFWTILAATNRSRLDEKKKKMQNIYKTQVHSLIVEGHQQQHMETFTGR